MLSIEVTLRFQLPPFKGSGPLNSAPFSLLPYSWTWPDRSIDLESLKDVECVVEAHSTYGIYDIIAKVEAESADRLNEVVTQQIRKLSNVRSTLTMMVIGEMPD